ncbi:YHYH domain-containing protein [Cetobacterium sp. 2A]|uniref:YHYH domain-containing protein n=1 Tax=Cetobacterium sp. 2A TaxID=2754723 RepID=UPI00163C5546|nr:YHYH domain-containing protein [Cetobacterium sp. 2A]MBC2855459.1 YHYH domain-containing protein [Cetobacterium sp. 2A]
MKRTLVLLILLSMSSFGHSGRLDSNGGHWNRKTGEYHYHRKSPSSYNSSSSKTEEEKVSKKTSIPQVKKIIPKKLMSEDEIYTNLLFLGYKGENAIYDFQKENGLVADGIAGTKTIELLKRKVSE